MKNVLYFIVLIALTFGAGKTSASESKNLVSDQKTLTITSDSLDNLHVLADLPSLENGILEFDITPLNSKGHIGAIIR